MVVVKMFQNDDTQWGILSLVLLLCCGIGALLAFIRGWMKADEWNIKSIMLAWTGIFIVNLILGLISFAIALSMGPQANPGWNFNP